jgi:hypothetical protein
MAFVVSEAVAAGLGVEAASLLEVKGALAAGCPGGTDGGCCCVFPFYVMIAFSPLCSFFNWG